MAKTNQAPRYVRVGNVLTTTLLRAGLPIVGPGLVIGNYPMYLLTVRGRKSGQLSTVCGEVELTGGKVTDHVVLDHRSCHTF
jgi:hypothetical protein